MVELIVGLRSLLAQASSNSRQVGPTRKTPEPSNLSKAAISAIRLRKVFQICVVKQAWDSSSIK